MFRAGDNHMLMRNIEDKSGFAENNRITGDGTALWPAAYVDRRFMKKDQVRITSDEVAVRSRFDRNTKAAR